MVPLNHKTLSCKSLSIRGIFKGHGLAARASSLGNAQTKGFVGEGTAHPGSGIEVSHFMCPLLIYFSLSIEHILLSCGKAADFCQKCC